MWLWKNIFPAVSCCIHKRSFLVALWFLPLSIHAQFPDFHVQSLDESNGVKTAGVNRIARDKDGFIWLLSPQSVQRYDGLQTRIFNVDADLRDLFIDSSGSIYVISLQSVWRYVNDYTGFVRVRTEAPADTHYYSATVAPGDSIFFHTSEGIYYQFGHDAMIRKCFIPGLQGDKTGRGRISFHRDHLFFINGGDLCRYNLLTKEVVKIHVHDIFSFAVLNVDKVMMGGFNFSHLLLDFSNGTILILGREHFRQPDAFISQHGYGSCRISNNEYLICTSKGLLKYDIADNSFTRENLFLKGVPLPADIRCLYIFSDAGKTVWIVTTSAILHFDPFEKTIGAIHSYTGGSSSSWDNWTRAITEDNEHNIWFATANGFCKWEKATGLVRSFLPDLSSNSRLNFPSIRGLVFDGKNLLIGQTSKGIWIFDPKSEHYQRPVFPPGSAGDSLRNKLEGDFIYGIFRMKNGNFFIHARSANYFLQQRNYHLSLISFGNKVIRGDYVIEDNHGRLWINNVDPAAPGLFCIDTTWHIQQFIPFHQTLDNRFIRPYCLLDDSTLLCGYAGVKMIDHIHNNPQIHEILPQLKNKSVRMIFKDNNNDIWIATFDELYRYSLSLGLLGRFDYSDNVTSSGTEVSNIFRATDGIVYLSSFDGLNYFFPEQIKRKTETLPVRLLSVSFGDDDSSYFIKKKISVDYSKNGVAFSFVVPYFKNPQKMMYRYRLEGEDKEWVQAGNHNFARYTSLSDGSYHFRVAASLDGLTWYEMAKPFDFTIRPPYWKTWWFRLMAGILLLTTSWILYSWLKRRRKEKEQLRINYEKKIAAMQMDTLRAQMNPHFIFNSLNSINTFILKNDQENATEYLQKFSTLVRLILDNSRHDWILLSNELVALELYIELESVRFGHSFSYCIKVDPGVETNSVLVPPLIIQPYAENAIRHGLINRQEPGGKLHISIGKKDNELLIEIRDNGIGREASAKLKTKINKLHQSSYGMQITAERLDIVNDVYNVQARVKATDLVKEDGSSDGTSILLTIQYKPNAGNNN